jgi:aminoglycoside phosphotransferase (APT) family kinase protein
MPRSAHQARPQRCYLPLDCTPRVIDFSSMGLGDPACDLPVAWNLLPEGVRDLFRATLQVDDATWARGRGWALSIALIQLPYYRDTNPVLAASARHVIREVLADHPGRGRR